MESRLHRPHFSEYVLLSLFLIFLLCVFQLAAWARRTSLWGPASSLTGGWGPLAGKGGWIGRAYFLPKSRRVGGIWLNLVGGLGV